MAKTLDQQLEAETLIRWDESSNQAVLWTASPKIRKEWKSYGFPVKAVSLSGWTCQVPVDRISYRPFKEGRSENLENLNKNGPKNDASFKEVS